MTTSSTFSVAQALDAWILRQVEPREPDQKWHPSGIWGCMRKAVYEMRGTPISDPRSASGVVPLWFGKHLHTWIQEAVSEDPLVQTYYSEVPVYDDELNIVGSADGLRFMADGTVEMDEIKSISEYGLKYGRKNGTLPKEDHLGQGKTYADLLRRHGSPALDIKPLGDKLRRVRFTYVNKANILDVEEIVIDLAPEQDRAKIEERVMDLEMYRSDPDSLPPRMPPDAKGKKSYMCEWGAGRCEFFTRCWQEDPDEVAPNGVEF